jgi:Alternative complex III, ActD subunit
MAETVFAVFDTPDEAVAAAGRLRRQGVPGSAITLMSSEPIHVEGIESAGGSKSRIALFAIAGGILGGASAILLTVTTSRSVDLVTGGMAIVSPWPFGIIVFELTALGAILCTLARMIYEAGLARRGAALYYDGVVADGKVALAVNCADDAQKELAGTALSPHIQDRP